jgi:hypothetical protein
MNNEKSWENIYSINNLIINSCARIFFVILSVAKNLDFIPIARVSKKIRNLYQKNRVPSALGIALFEKLLLHFTQEHAQTWQTRILKGAAFQGEAWAREKK